ncbi:hypothetical protein M427DRAFT_135578 [Gonapodya prolifera JEL478]|uniref:Uncharacterized protein n=1 Tax=Gonapodya prolifera (strain JEL478) TaxID=1344416 RepID=A0A139AD07_GONPJ|nr:hypothetical protein M427DRAFT_135578 [Gonapodya prolifera JEL478]|eukprot:KXS14650.1 hypothetical protein M427DRAFT_135578 [Gonapodya prolifera JEL478]
MALSETLIFVSFSTKATVTSTNNSSSTLSTKKHSGYSRISEITGRQSPARARCRASGELVLIFRFLGIFDGPEITQRLQFLRRPVQTFKNSVPVPLLDVSHHFSSSWGNGATGGKDGRKAGFADRVIGPDTVYTVSKASRESFESNGCIAPVIG